MKKLLLSLFAALLTTTAMAQAPDWSVDPNDFDNSMTLVAVVEIEDVELANASDQLGAFVGTELRGTAKSIFFSSQSRYYFFITIYSDEVIGESITFEAYDAENDRTVSLANIIEFTADLISGDLSNPVLLTDDADAVDDEGPVVGDRDATR